MKTPRADKSRKPKAAKPRGGAPESPQSNETFKLRQATPGNVGLANETRPGLGTRHDEPFPGENLPETPTAPSHAATGNVAERQHSGREPNDQPLPREPREQKPNTWAHEAERSTGVSGHTSAD